MTATNAGRKTPVWASILLILLIAAIAAFAGLMAGKFFGATEERQVQVLRSVEGEEQVILLTAGVTDIQEKRESQDFFGLFSVPFSERAVFLRYDLDAKFGIEGEVVDIRPTGDSSYTIKIPEFIFLGYDNPEFQVAAEDNGLLSWTTPEIDKLEAIEEVLTDDIVSEHIDGFRPLLEEQAITFYTRIVSSIEPDATLTFEFAE